MTETGQQPHAGRLPRGKPMPERRTDPAGSLRSIQTVLTRRVGAGPSALQPGATALDNALRAQRAEALPVTDDPIQLYHSGYLSQPLSRSVR